MYCQDVFEKKLEIFFIGLKSKRGGRSRVFVRGIAQKKYFKKCAYESRDFVPDAGAVFWIFSGLFKDLYNAQKIQRITG